MTGVNLSHPFSQRVRLRRAELGLSMRQAAKRAGIDRSTWLHWERGETTPTVRSQGGLERVLGWAPGTVAAMLSREGDYVDPVTGEEYVDPDERELWDLRHHLGLRYVTAYGQERAAEMGANRARELIAYLRSRTAMDPPEPGQNPRNAQVA